MNKILSFFLASFLALAFVSVTPMLPIKGDGVARAADCVKIRVNDEVVCVKGVKLKKDTSKKGLTKKGNSFVGGLVGGLAGSIVGNLVTRPGPTTVVVQERSYSPEPWTPEWYDYCANRYRSFDPRTGYYWTYNGFKRFCR